MRPRPSSHCLQIRAQMRARAPAWPSISETTLDPHHHHQLKTRGVDDRPEIEKDSPSKLPTVVDTHPPLPLLSSRFSASTTLLVFTSNVLTKSGIATGSHVAHPTKDQRRSSRQLDRTNPPNPLHHQFNRHGFHQRPPFPLSHRSRLPLAASSSPQLFENLQGMGTGRRSAYEAHRR